MKAKVRGIYSTALTKLLLENGFEIVQPSLTIKKRFKLDENQEPPDLKIKDRFDLQGIRVLGTPEATSAFQHMLHSSLEDVLTRRWTVSVDGIYRGSIKESDERFLYVDLGCGVTGRLPKSEVTDGSPRQVIVQVERKRLGVKQPVLTTKLKVFGNHAILAKNSKTGVSLKIYDLEKRAELYALGKALSPKGWGIIWRESSKNQPREALENEVARLFEKIKTLDSKTLSAETPTLLVEGLHFIDVEFPYLSKRRLDSFRASVAQTLNGHHFYKSCGGKVSAALEMAEKLLEKGQDRAEVENLFKKQVMYEFPEAGSQMDVQHVKLSGLVLHLGEATMEEIDSERIRFRRAMRSNGFYDGLGTRKEAGDQALSETKPGEWYIKTKYFSKDGEWKGTYINLNTPVEVYPKTLRYVDLEVDICVRPNGTVKVLDMEKLEKAFEKGFISKRLFETVKEKATQIKNSVIR